MSIPRVAKTPSPKPEGPQLIHGKFDTFTPKISHFSTANVSPQVVRGRVHGNRPGVQHTRGGKT